MMSFKGFTPLYTTLCVTSLLAGLANPAHAQNMNYGSLEDIFQEPVTTSATGTAQRVSEVPADMTIITADQIRQAGTRSIPQIIGIYAPGVSVLQESTNTYDISMGGYQHTYNSRLLVLIDGRQVFSDDYSRTPWNNLPVNVDDIRQIEIVDGTSSALFGSNATSGVINIITNSPLYDNSNVVSANIGERNSESLDGTTTLKMGDGGFKVSAGGYNDKQFNTAYTNVDTPPSGNFYQGYTTASGVYKITPQFIANTEFSYSSDYNTEAVNTEVLKPVQTTSYSGRAGFSWNTPIGQIKNDNYINYNLLDYTIFTGTNLDPQNSLIVSRFEDLIDIGSSNTFRTMVEYRNKGSITASSPSFDYQKTSLDQNVYTMGGAWLWHIRDNLSLTNAVRYDVNTTDISGTISPTAGYALPQNDNYSTVSINSGLVYKPTTNDSFRLTYGRGVQNPSFFDSSYNFDFVVVPSQNIHAPNVLLAYQANPEIKPTVVQTYELGYDRKVNPLASTARMSVFYQVNQNLVTSNISTQFIRGNVVEVTQDSNVGNSSSTGTTLQFLGQKNGFRWDASYTYQNVDDQTNIGNNGSAPHDEVKLSLGYTLGNWEFDAHNQYASSTDMLRNNFNSYATVPLSGYYSLGGRVGYKINDYMTAALYGTNLTRQYTTESPYASIERRVFLGLTGHF